MADFAAFEAAYDAANGVGAFATIPEPAAATLLIICGTTAMLFRRKNGKHRIVRPFIVLAAAVAACGAASTASAQTGTITNPGTAAAGDKANTSAFAFRDGGTFPSTVSPPGSLTDLFVLTA